MASLIYENGKQWVVEYGSISDKLREEILASGKTRYRISAESQISQGMLSRFIRGETDLSLSNVDKLCDSLGINLMLLSPSKRSKPRRVKKADVTEFSLGGAKTAVFISDLLCQANTRKAKPPARS